VTLLTNGQIEEIKQLARSIARKRFYTGNAGLLNIHFYVAATEKKGFWQIRGKLHEVSSRHADYRRDFYFSRRKAEALAIRQCKAANLRLNIEINRAHREMKVSGTYR
jgi:hypothetical protein